MKIPRNYQVILDSFTTSLNYPTFLEFQGTLLHGTDIEGDVIVLCSIIIEKEVTLLLQFKKAYPEENLADKQIKSRNKNTFFKNFRMIRGKVFEIW